MREKMKEVQASLLPFKRLAKRPANSTKWKMTQKIKWPVLHLQYKKSMPILNGPRQITCSRACPIVGVTRSCSPSFQIVSLLSEGPQQSRCAGIDRLQRCYMAIDIQLLPLHTPWWLLRFIFFIFGAYLTYINFVFHRNLPLTYAFEGINDRTDDACSSRRCHVYFRGIRSE